jgi:ribosomal protein L40E
MSRVPEEDPRFQYQFTGEPELSNDSYQLYLTKKYAIEKNDVLSKYIVGENSFPDVSSALSYAHNLEKEKSQIKKSIAKKDGSIECGKCGGTNTPNTEACRYCKHPLVL